MEKHATTDYINVMNPTTERECYDISRVFPSASSPQVGLLALSWISTPADGSEDGTPWIDDYD